MTAKPDLARRGLLLRLGLMAGAVHAAPTLMHVNAGRTSTGGSGASGGASGASGRAWSGRERRAAGNSRPSR